MATEVRRMILEPKEILNIFSYYSQVKGSPLPTGIAHGYTIVQVQPLKIVVSIQTKEGSQTRASISEQDIVSACVSFLIKNKIPISRKSQKTVKTAFLQRIAHEADRIRVHLPQMRFKIADKNVERHGLSTSRQARPAGQHFLSEFGGAAGSRPGAFGEADGAAQGFAEIGDAFIEIDEPFFDPAHGLLLVEDGAGRSGLDANLAIETEILGADIDGLVGDQRHIGGHRR